MLMFRLLYYSQTRAFSFTSSLYKGHSKWQNIKDIKLKNDLIKNEKQNKLLGEMKSAVAEGYDVQKNKRLADLQDKFRQQGLPLDAFNKSLNRLKNKTVNSGHMVVIGPNGSSIIIEYETEQKEKFFKEIQKTIVNIGSPFRLVTENNSSLINMCYDQKGVIRIAENAKDGKKLTFEQAEEICIENDCEEINQINEDEGIQYEFLVDAQSLHKTSNSLRDQGFEVEMAEFQYISKMPVNIKATDYALVQELCSKLVTNDQVKNLYDNLANNESVDKSRAKA